MTPIDHVTARRVWDSRGRPTVEVEVHAGGHRGRAIAPAGASRGSGEACDLRDGGAALGGYDVRRAVAGVAEAIAPALRGLDVGDQAAVDSRLVAADGTPDRSRLGGNALVATSMAAAWCAAAAAGRPLWRHLADADGTTPRLPLPEVQVIGGGAHASRRLDLQDLMVVCPGAPTLADAFDMTAEVYLAAGALLAERGRRQGVADEGGWWPAFDANEEALALLVAAVERAGFAPGGDVALSLDVAATELFDAGTYRLALDGVALAPDAFRALVGQWCRRHHVVAVEDPQHEADLAGTARFTAAVGAGVLVVGDDLVVTNAARIAEAARAGAADTVLIKPNQAGTLTEALAAVRAARSAGYRVVVSARSGETEDVTLCHLAVGWGADLVKVGSITRGERTAKWNELLRIAEQLGGDGGFDARGPWRR